jgi:hypothetical protein
VSTSHDVDWVISVTPVYRTFTLRLVVVEAQYKGKESSRRPSSCLILSYPYPYHYSICSYSLVSPYRTHCYNIKRLVRQDEVALEACGARLQSLGGREGEGTPPTEGRTKTYLIQFARRRTRTIVHIYIVHPHPHDLKS